MMIVIISISYLGKMEQDETFGIHGKLKSIYKFIRVKSLIGAKNVKNLSLLLAT